MIRFLHPVAGVVAMATISTFIVLTLRGEMAGDAAAILAAKTAIAEGLWLLVPTMAVLALTGRRLGAGSDDPRVAAKRRRMRIVQANGLLVLLPTALTLHWLAAAGNFDLTYMLLQGVELIAGPANLFLLALSFRDGLVLAGRLRRRQRAN